MSYLPCVEIEPQSAADSSIIWLHGLGANGHDFEPIVPQLQLPASLAVRFIFPHAPSIPVTINNGFVMPAWYDILDLSVERKLDEAQFMKSCQATRALIEREIERGIPSQRIILAGFSQGGAIVYETGLSFQQPLAGLLALSTYFATHETVKPNPANQKIPITIHHGSMDPVVPEQLGQQAIKRLQQLKFNPQYKTYPMQHEVCQAQISDISRWIQTQLSTTSIS